MNTVLIILGVAFGIVLVLIAGWSFFASGRDLWRTPSRTDLPFPADPDAVNPSTAGQPDHRGRAYELVAHLPPNTDALKCSNCGAIIDSTAELSAKGEVKCNYCNKWSSIYQ